MNQICHQIIHENHIMIKIYFPEEENKRIRIYNIEKWQTTQAYIKH